jgi:hypothetical protein
MDKRNIALDKLIEGFVLYNRTPNKSPRTVDWYSERLGGFRNLPGKRMIGRCGTQARISSLHQHRLRHTFATRFLALGLGYLPVTAAAWAHEL